MKSALFAIILAGVLCIVTEVSFAQEGKLQTEFRIENTTNPSLMGLVFTNEQPVIKGPLPLGNGNKVGIGDFNNDGYEDAFVGFCSINAFNFAMEDVLLMNDKKGNLKANILWDLPQDSTQAVGVADLDQDGDLDVVLGNFMSSLIGCGEPDLVYFNVGTRYVSVSSGGGSVQGSKAASKVTLYGVVGFQPYQLPLDLEATGDIALGDVDGDGDIDIIAANGNSSCGSGNSKLYLNDYPAKTFHDGTNGPVTGLPVGTSDVVKLADLDNDADLDLMVSDFYGNRLEIYKNNGMGLFTLVPGAILPYIGGFDIGLADFDADGDLDAVITGASASANINILENGGQGIFTFPSSGGKIPVPLSCSIGKVDVGDFDGDGNIDFVVGRICAGVPMSTWIYLNTGNFTFQPDSNYVIFPDMKTNIQGYYPAIGDFNNDGKLDLIVSRTGDVYNPLAQYLQP